MLTGAPLTLSECKAQCSRLPIAVPMPTEGQEIVMNGNLSRCGVVAATTLYLDFFIDGVVTAWLPRTPAILRRTCLNWRKKLDATVQNGRTRSGFLSATTISWISGAGACRPLELLPLGVGTMKREVALPKVASLKLHCDSWLCLRWGSFP